MLFLPTLLESTECLGAGVVLLRRSFNRLPHHAVHRSVKGFGASRLHQRTVPLRFRRRIYPSHDSSELKTNLGELRARQFVCLPHMCGTGIAREVPPVTGNSWQKAGKTARSITSDDDRRASKCYQAHGHDTCSGESADQAKSAQHSQLPQLSWESCDASRPEVSAARSTAARRALIIDRLKRLGPPCALSCLYQSAVPGASIQPMIAAN